MIAERMPNLEVLSVAVYLALLRGAPAPEFFFPNGLRSLSLDFINLPREESTIVIPSLLVAIRARESNLRDLKITVMTDDREEMSEITGSMLEPLRSLHQLTALHLNFLDEFEEEHAIIIRDLPRLTSITIGELGLSAAGLQTLAERPGYAAQIKHLSLDWTDITEEHATILQQFTSLEEFKPRGIEFEDLSFMAALTQLRECVLEYVIAEPDEIVTRLSGLSNLEVLDLRCEEGLTSDHLTSLLPNLPRLSSLALRGCGSLGTLAWVRSSPHLATNLKRLLFEECQGITPTAEEIGHLRVLRALESITFLVSLSHELDEKLRNEIDPKSGGGEAFRKDIWPNLTEFVFKQLYS